MPEITRVFRFDAAHRILGHQGKCIHLHGHGYVAEVTVQAPSLDALGMVVDFSVIKEKVGKWIEDNWDHNAILNKGDPLVPFLQNNGLTTKKPYVLLDHRNPTAEELAEELFYVARDLLPDLKVIRVRIWETPNCCADFSV